MTFSRRIALHLTILLAGLVFLFQNCQYQNQKLGSTAQSDPAITQALKDLGNRCSLPWDPTQFADTDEAVTAFRSVTAAEEAGCVSEERICENGALSGSFENPSCTVLPHNNSDCISPWNGGAVIAHGGEITAYHVDATTRVCSPEIRKCMEGDLSGSAMLMACPHEDSCQTPWGLVVGEEQNLMVLDDRGTPATKDSCDANIYTYSCDNQKLSKVVSRPACAGTVLPR